MARRDGTMGARVTTNVTGARCVLICFAFVRHVWVSDCLFGKILSWVLHGPLPETSGGKDGSHPPASPSSAQKLRSRALRAKRTTHLPV